MQCVPRNFQWRPSAHIPAICLCKNHPDHSAMCNCNRGSALCGDLQKNLADTLQHISWALALRGSEIESPLLVFRHRITELGSEVVQPTTLPGPPAHFSQAAIVFNFSQSKRTGRLYTAGKRAAKHAKSLVLAGDPQRGNLLQAIVAQGNIGP